MAELNRARLDELIAPYLEKPWVRGMYLVGSAARPYRDEISDFDIEIAVEDAAFVDIPLSERHVFEIDLGPPRRVKHEFLLRSWSELESLAQSTRDVDHTPFQHAMIVHDPLGEVAALFEKLSILPDMVREERCRVHYVELMSAVGRSAKCFERGDTVNTRYVVSDGVAAFLKLVFLARGRWPPLRHWARNELDLLESGGTAVEAIERAQTAPDGDTMKNLAALAREALAAGGLTFFEDFDALRVWAFLTDEGHDAFVRWGAK